MPATDKPGHPNPEKTLPIKNPRLRDPICCALRCLGQEALHFGIEAMTVGTEEASEAPKEGWDKAPEAIAGIWDRSPEDFRVI